MKNKFRHGKHDMLSKSDRRNSQGEGQRNQSSLCNNGELPVERELAIFFIAGVETLLFSLPNFQTSLLVLHTLKILVYKISSTKKIYKIQNGGAVCT